MMDAAGLPRAERGRRTILVAEAQTIGSIAVLRSLARAGYRVLPMSSHADALGFSSSLVRSAVHCPRYDAPQFLDWFDELIAREHVALVVPSESLALALRPRFPDYAALLPAPADGDVYYRAFSKVSVLDLMRRGDAGGMHAVPAFAFVRRPYDRERVRAALAQLGEPLWLKADSLHADAGADNVVVRVDDPEQACATAGRLLSDYSCVLVQAHFAAPLQVGYNAVMDRGQPIAESMMLAERETPPGGGLTAYRRGWWHDAIAADARRRIALLDWQGPVMLEYRFDPDGERFAFIEVNARFWGALHLDLYAGVDFPTILADAFFGARPAQLQRAQRGAIARLTVPTDIGHLREVLRAPQSGIGRKLGAAAAFGLAFVDPRVRDDLNFPGDRRLYWIRWARFIRDIGKA